MADETLNPLGSDQSLQSPVYELDRSLIARQERVQREAAGLKGNLDAMLSREQVLIDEVGKAKARTALKPEVDGVIEELQKRAHERSVGSFERMLTGITNDVLPDYKGRRTVKLELSNEHTMPALDIYIDNMGKPEKITSGAVANVVSTGLRFISLARSSARGLGRAGARRLLVLDEADCWIDGIAVQKYFNVINQLSREAGIQTVVITHHDLSAFAEEFRIYRISDIQSPDGVDARSMDMVSPGRMAPNELNPNHISFIGLKNIEAYPDSAIELSPGVTVIQGANQRGKSVWRRALSAACMAESGEEIIRHNNDTGEISIGFADGRVLEYQRFRKGATKAEFAMHSPESWSERLNGASLKSMRDGPIAPLHHTVGAKLPEWVPRETGVYKVEDINIQLWGQFTPVFMLDKPASARASLLSIGRESGYLYAMSETYKSDLKEDSTRARDGEKEIAAIRGSAKEMQDLPALIVRIDALREEALVVNDEAKEIKEIAQLSAQLRVLRERSAAMDAQLVCAELLADIPIVEPTERLSSWMASMARAKADAAFEVQCVVTPAPMVEETAFAERVIGGIASARQFDEISKNLPDAPQIPSVEGTSQVESILDKLAQARRESSVEPTHPFPGMPEVQPTAEVEGIIKRLEQARRESSVEPEQIVPSMPAVQGTTEITNLLVSLKTTAQGVLANDKELKALQQELARIEQKMQEATEALGGECPVCHSVMTMEMLLSKDGASGHSHANDTALVATAAAADHLKSHSHVPHEPHEPHVPASEFVLPATAEPTVNVEPVQQLVRSAAAAVAAQDTVTPAAAPVRMKFRR